MAYPTVLEETRAGTLSAHPGYVCRWGENGTRKTLTFLRQFFEADHLSQFDSSTFPLDSASIIFAMSRIAFDAAGQVNPI